MCKLYATKACSTGTSWPFKVGPISYPNTMEWDYHFMLRTIPKDSRSKNVQFLCVLPTGECKMVKIHTYIYICSVTLLQKMSNTVKSHDLPCQGIGLALSTEHCCSSSKVSSSQNTTILEALIFWYQIKKNPHTEINQLAVTAKIFSQPGIQLCVATVAVQVMANRLSWAVWGTSLACSSFMSHLNTDHTAICQRWENYSS